MVNVVEAAASSRPLERDARLVSTDERHVSPSDIALGVVIGRTSEAFDFFVFGIACALVFPSVVFPFVSPIDGTLLSFAVFSLAFLFRPVGSVLFLAIDRRHGRGVKLTAALFLLGASTAAIAFLPGYDDIGYWSVAILVLMRIGQGIALGGAWDGLASLLALNAPPHRRGLYAMVPQLGAPIGLMVAAGLFAFFMSNLSPEDFLSWGWRYPFFVAFTINVVALFARLRLVATEEFAELLETRDLVPVRVRSLVRLQWKDILIGAFVPLASYALFHLVTIFPLSFVQLFTDGAPESFLELECLGAVSLTIGVVVSGLLADFIGRRTLLGSTAAGVAGFSFAIPFLLTGGLQGHLVFVLVGFGLLGVSFGQAAGAVASNFSTQNRYTGSALTSDMAWLIGAGFAPLVALGGYDLFGLWAVVAYLLSGAACTLGALGFNRGLAMRND
jgi:MFS family permease